MIFRPYPGFTAVTLVLLAILCGLGVWQLERLQGKLALIATVDRQIHAPAIALDDAASRADYAHVFMSGRFDNAKESYLFTTGLDGAPVYHVIAPFTATGGRIWLVDRGMVPKELLDPARRRAGLIEGETRVTGIWRRPDPPGVFTPPADPVHRVWYGHDLPAIAALDHMRLGAPGILEADATPNPGGWPKGGQTVVSFRNAHLSYAVTWFGMALGLLGVWITYHVSKGRLAWGRSAAYKPGAPEPGEKG